MTDVAALEAAGLLDGVEGEDARRDRIELLEYLLRDGFELDELKDAAAAGRLGLLPIDRVLQGGDPARYSAIEVAEKAGLDLDFLRRLWRSLGMADVEDDIVAFSPRDLEAARTVAGFREAGLDDESLILISQVLGQTMSHLGETLNEVVGDALLQAGDTERTAGLRWADAAKYMVPQLTPLLEYQLTVHMRERLKSQLIQAAELEAGKLDGSRDITVCFADLVGFTKLGERVPPAELSMAGRQLTGLAVEAARPPVRLVKMIGDAAMLVSTEPEPLLRAALELSEASENDERMPAPLRVGVACGQAVPHMGDWLGAPINLASRVTDVAKPGSVLATKDVREQASEGFRWSDAGSRRFKGVREPVRLYRVRPAESGS